ncbi:MAG TPA: diacylglycerol kinase family protein [Ktedonobacteraceae bacterium]|nr:diacylglycerol kinase family protein [Ktedonobacteraceae bacterium]
MQTGATDSHHNQDSPQEQVKEDERTVCYAVIIANPTSGFMPLQMGRLHDTLTFLRSLGWRVELRYTQGPGDGTELARRAVEEQADMVIAAGGDGTINDIIQGLVGSETALAVLPTGTVNVWAREMGIPLDAHGARQVLVNGQTRRVDVGCINGRYFLLMVGIGIDGTITQAVEHKPLKRLGVLGYALAALWFGPGYKGFPVVVNNNGVVVKTRALQIFVGNTQLYAGAFKFTWQARLDDGLLDLCIVRKRSHLGRIVVLWDFILRRDQRRMWVRYDQVSSVQIETPKPVAYQIDGDAGGHTPVTLSIAHEALKVIVPQKAPHELFSE